MKKIRGLVKIGKVMLDHARDSLMMVEELKKRMIEDVAKELMNKELLIIEEVTDEAYKKLDPFSDMYKTDFYILTSNEHSQVFFKLDQIYQNSIINSDAQLKIRLDEIYTLLNQ